MSSLTQTRALFALAAAAGAAAFLPGCANGPTLNTSAQNTPMAHPEAKVLFVKLRDGTRVLPDDVVDLKFGHKLVVARENADGTLVDNGEGSDVLKNDMIQRGSNFSVILNSVWIPEKLNINGKSMSRDIAAVLDIVLDDGEVEPIVVAYQREVRGGHLLNFKNIVVTSVEKWDGVHQPYFRLRILDVRSERNTNTQVMLEQAAQMVNTVAGIVPSPYLPAVSKAIEASKFILGNKDNEILLDYRIQFFNLQQSESTASGSATVSKVLDPFYQGNWIAFGRPKEIGDVPVGPEFWSGYFYYDRPTGMISKSGDRGQPRPAETPSAAERETVTVPYVSVVIVKESFGVSKVMKQAFKELSQIITSGEDKSSPQEVANLATLLEEYANYLKNADKINADVMSVQDASAVSEKRTILTSLVRAYTEYVNDGKLESASHLKTEMQMRLGLDVDVLTMEPEPTTRSSPGAPARVVNTTMIDALQFN
jgi:hypothetical protein